MINFLNFLSEEKQPLEISEEEIDSLVNNLTWDDIKDLYSDDEFADGINEAISASERLRKAQSMRAKQQLLKVARNVKLKRASPMPVLKKRAQLAARNILYKKLLKNKDKNQLSPSEKGMIEYRVKTLMNTFKYLPQKLIPKIRDIERTRLAAR
jgi:hypothetical protein